ncbi:AAA family ATPase, partial [Vibrio sp. ZSDE26]
NEVEEQVQALESEQEPEDVIADVEESTVEPEQETVADNEVELTDGLDEIPETFDALELPEYNEEDALADMPVDDELSNDVESGSYEEAVETFDEQDLPEYSEDDALADMPVEAAQDDLADDTDVLEESTSELIESEHSISESVTLDDRNEELKSEPVIDSPESEASSEQDALFDVFQAQDIESLSRDEFDEGALSELLSESDEDLDVGSFSFDTAIDTQTSDSAGMDIDAMLEMGGEDWNGFNLSPEQQASISTDIPDEEKEVWSEDNKPEEAEVSDENWEQQEDFDSTSNQYRTIDELMAEVDHEEETTPDDEELNLNVGLDEFPDVIGDIGFEDVDTNAEAVGKLDLAKIYMEMNDAAGAIKLLEEAIVDGSDAIRQEAKGLIDTIRKS